MARQRKKSIRDIEAQLKRIEALSERRTTADDRTGYRRFDDARQVANRYINNTFRRLTPMGYYARQDDPVWDKKVTRRVYMGLSAG